MLTLWRRSLLWVRLVSLCAYHHAWHSQLRGWLPNFLARCTGDNEWQLVFIFASKPGSLWIPYYVLPQTQFSCSIVRITRLNLLFFLLVSSWNVFFFFLWSNQFNFAEGKPKLMHPLNTTEMHRQDTMCLLLRFLPSPLTIPQPVVMVTVAIITKFLWNWKDPSPWGTSIRWEGILVVTCCGQVSPFPKLSRGWLVILHNGEISSPFYWVNWSFSVSSGRQKLK